MISAANPFAAVPARRTVPHEFVLDALTPADPATRPMFGCVAVYAYGKLVFILRDKGSNTADNGVWLATRREHHASLREHFPHMRSVGVLGKGPTNWQVLPAEADDFEAAAVRACELVLDRDPRIGTVPGASRAARRRGERPAQPGARGRARAAKPAAARRRRTRNGS